MRSDFVTRYEFKSGEETGQAAPHAHVPQEQVVVQEVGEKTIFDMNLETEGNDEDVAQFEEIVRRFNTKAMTMFNQGRTTDAMTELKRVIKFIYDFYPGHNELLALSFNNISCVYKKQQDFTTGLECLAHALTLIKADDKARDLRSLTLLNMSAIYSAKGSHSQSKTYAQ